MKQKSLGIVLSYILILLDLAIGILFVPFLLKTLGGEEYGLYKLMLATASYLSVLDFGLGGTITRYVIKYKTENDRKKEENLLAMGFTIYGILALCVILLAVVISFCIPRIYRASIMAEQFHYAKSIFLFVCTNTAVNLCNHAYNGLLLAYERYVYQRIVNIFKVLLRVTLLVGILPVIKYGIVIAGIDLILSVSILLLNAGYTKYVLKCTIRLHEWDFGLLREMLVFTSAILMQSVINQFNSNVDSMVLGMFTTTTTVAMYSIVLQLFTMYSTLSTAVSSVYLPAISKAVFKGADDDEVTKRVVEPSRIQLMILLLALSGFLLFGKDFIKLWVGTEYLGVYPLACVLLISSTLELSQNSITSVLKAKNILHGKTWILFGSTAVNVLLTVMLVPEFGAAGAVAGTAFSMVFGYGIALNVYYQKKAGLNMRLYYKQTYSGILMAAAISFGFGCVFTNIMCCKTFFGFFRNAGIYSCDNAVTWG